MRYAFFDSGLEYKLKYAFSNLLKPETCSITLSYRGKKGILIEVMRLALICPADRVTRLGDFFPLGDL
jgi:hypothetical protein